MNILLLVLIIFLAVWGVFLFIQRAPKYGPTFLIRVGLFLAFIALIILALTGRMHWVIGILAGLLPLAKRYLPIALLRLIPFWGQAGSVFGQNGQQTAGQKSEVITDVLKMTLDHDSGDMDGEVLSGNYQGQQLSSLTVEQLKEIYQYCQQHDQEALRLLVSYLQRHHQDAWQQYQYSDDSSSDTAGAESSTDVSIEEALEILELNQNPTEEDIVKAHKRMMAKFHPDRGGSHYMAVKINQAKELLLSRL